MNDLLLERWKQCKTEAGFAWSELTAAEIESVQGSRESLIALIESRYGYARRRAEKEVDLFISDFGDRLRRAA